MASVVAALVLGGCNLAIGVDVEVAADGSGTLEVAFRLDEELSASLEADGFDPTFGLDELARSGTEWDVDVNGGSSTTVRLRAPFSGADALADRVAELNAGIDVTEDGSLLDELTVGVEPDGRVVATGRATLVVPATTGATGDGVVFDGDDLRALLEAEGTDILLAEVRFRMPGPVEASNADRIDGDTAIWLLEPFETRELRAEATPSTDRTGLLIAAGVLLGIVVGVGVSLLRRP